MAQLADELIPTRATLIQRLKDWQDQASWQDFFDTYWLLIYGIALKGGLTRSEAEEVVQETLISVAKHMPTFQYDPSIGSFKAWLLNMTRWRISDHLRKRNYQIVPHQPDGDDFEIKQEAEQVQPPDLEKLWDVEWENNLLNAAIARARRRLDPGQYQIFDFYVNKQWEPDEVARTFSIPVNQVYLAKHRVTEAIRLEIARLRKDMV